MDIVEHRNSFLVYFIFKCIGFLWLREVDGTGTVQTPELKLISIGVWSAFFIIPCCIQITWFIFNLIKSKK
ncbi:DUF3923 family protein [Staphylococcus agnetis]|uniref:DUF3923 family protein n=1 Tax=Staphylococcus agnetis TaxID=985762 RepID=UPI003EB9EFC5